MPFAMRLPGEATPAEDDLAALQRIITENPTPSAETERQPDLLASVVEQPKPAPRPAPIIPPVQPVVQPPAFPPGPLGGPAPSGPSPAPPLGPGGLMPTAPADRHTVVMHRFFDRAFGDLADSEKNPLFKRAWEVASEKAKRSIHVKSIVDAYDDGQKAHDSYLEEMAKQGMVDAALLKAQKYKMGGGPGGSGDLGLKAANMVALGIRGTVSTVLTKQGYQGILSARQGLKNSLTALETNTSLGNVEGFMQQIKGIESRLSDKDREFYMAPGGLGDKLRNILSQAAGTGRVTPEIMAEVKKITHATLDSLDSRQQQIEAEANAAKDAYIEAMPGVKGKQKERFRSYGATMSGAGSPEDEEMAGLVE